MLRISTVIPTHNRAVYLKSALESLASQTLSHSEYEVIVVDNASTDDTREVRYVRTLPGVNISYKRKVVEGIGPQDEALFCREDVDYNWRVKQAGYQVYLDPRIKVYHHHRPTLRALLNQHYMYGRAYYLVRRKWPSMYSVYPRGIRSPKDLLKAVKVVAALLYQPLVTALRGPSPGAVAAFIPVTFLAELACGARMLVQACRARSFREGQAAPERAH